MNIKWISGVEYADLLIKNVFGIVVVIPTENEDEYTRKMIKSFSKVKTHLQQNYEIHFELSLEGKSDEYHLPTYFIKEKDYLDHAENEFAGLVRVTTIGDFDQHPLISKRLKEGAKGAQVFDEHGRELIGSLIMQVWNAKISGNQSSLEMTES
ncbi:MAG: hypothetical protein GOU98_02740 [Candidatus Altiarchaeota archaeon]|nr:hypothetical protein [Candidatus Altiarchaeota archaeon]